MSSDDRGPLDPDEVGALTHRLRNLSRAIAEETASREDGQTFAADRDALLARLDDDTTSQENRVPESRHAPVADQPERGPLAVPAPDDQLVTGWIELPGGLPPDEDELEDEARRLQLARWHADDTTRGQDFDDGAGWSR